jgi:hypothetical protein
MSEAMIRSEIHESVPFLKGVLDLSTLEEHAPIEDAEILSLGGSTRDDEIFKIKLQALLSSEAAKDQFSVYLGRRTAEFKDQVQREGFQILNPGLSSDFSKTQSIFTISQANDSGLAHLWKTARQGRRGSVAAVSHAPLDLLQELASKKSSGENIEPILAMSIPQLLSSMKAKP